MGINFLLYFLFKLLFFVFVTATANKTRHSGAQGKLFWLRFQALYPPQLNVELKFNHKYSHYLRNEPFCSIFHKSLGQQATFKYTSLFLFFSPICEWTKCQCPQNIPNIICTFLFVLVSSEDMQTNCFINAPHPLLSALYGSYSPFG